MSARKCVRKGSENDYKELQRLKIIQTINKVYYFLILNPFQTDA